MNLPNIITISRLLLTPYIVWLILSESYFLGFIFFLLSGVSDALDGFIAKRFNQQTLLGSYLDPIADKFLVFLVLISLIYQRESIILFVITILIIIREIFVMSLREWMASFSRSNLVKVSSLGKTKTITQMTGIGMIIGTPIINFSYYFELSILVLVIGTFFAYLSAYKYFKQSFPYIR